MFSMQKATVSQNCKWRPAWSILDQIAMQPIGVRALLLRPTHTVWTAVQNICDDAGDPDSENVCWGECIFGREGITYDITRS